MKRFESTKTVNIKASVKDTMWLPCPVTELKWIPNWSYEMIYSESGVNEVGCIFTETMSGPVYFGEPVKCYWNTIILNEDTFVAHLSYDDKGAAIYTFTVKDKGDGTVDATWHILLTSYEETSINMTAGIETVIEFISNCAKHYLETGEMISL